MGQIHFLSFEQVQRIHLQSIERFGGIHGIRDRGLLESALAMPAACFGGQDLHPSLFDKAAAYLFHIVQNHPFLDGNKRAGYACAAIFLRGNGYKLQPQYQESLYHLVMHTADGQHNKSEIALALEAYSRPLQA